MQPSFSFFLFQQGNRHELAFPHTPFYPTRASHAPSMTPLGCVDVPESFWPGVEQHDQHGRENELELD